MKEEENKWLGKEKVKGTPLDDPRIAGG